MAEYLNGKVIETKEQRITKAEKMKNQPSVREALKEESGESQYLKDVYGKHGAKSAMAMMMAGFR